MTGYGHGAIGNREMARAWAMNDRPHASVLLDAAVDALSVRPGGVYVDATYGRGGHTGAILERLGGQGRLLAVDRDPDAQAHAERSWGREPLFQFRRTGFDRLGAMIADAGLTGRVDGILFDLGLSSPQVDDASRGFSFRHGGPLDMRMDPDTGESAAEWLARADLGDIAGVLRRYGEEKLAGRIARAIVTAREQAPIDTTDRLAAIVADATPARIAAGSRIHPATRTFQALRILVNDELGALQAALDACPAALADGGRLAVISFHSLEDRIVKRFMRAEAHPPPPPVPMATEPEPGFALVGKPRRPDAAEVAANPRARSAVLRIAERRRS